MITQKDLYSRKMVLRAININIIVVRWYHMIIEFVFLFFCFSTGLVRLYIAGLPLRSCRTIGNLLCRGLPNVRFFLFLVDEHLFVS